ncbi:c-type cytochrome [Rhodothermus profundi]|nr:cytochrome c [Rhodothermus profundi]
MGERIYQQQCAVCHGPRGRGDGPAGMALNPRPADLTSKAVQAQTDGALFWKISEGRGAMPAFKGMLSEAERWQVVTYVRTLARK